MGYLSKTLIKKILNQRLKGFVKKYGYTLQSYRGELIIHKENENKLSSIHVSFSTYDDLMLNQAFIGYIEVERILYKIENLQFEYKEFPMIVTMIISGNDFKRGRLAGKLEKEEDFDEIIDNFKTAFLDYYLPAFEYYSDPKNVLELWDSLDDKIHSNQFQSPLNLVKMMIFSKICNEDKYRDRCQEAIDYYQFKINSGKTSWQEELDICHKVIKYLAENNI